MKKFYRAVLLFSLPLLMAAGIPNFFANLIGKNVHSYCRLPSDEQTLMLQSINRNTDNHQVMVVCGEIIEETEKSPRPLHRRRMGK